MTEKITEMRKHKKTGDLVYKINDEWYSLDQVYREHISEEIAQEDTNKLIFRKEAERDE